VEQSSIRCTLVTDGTSDHVLSFHLTWLMRQYTRRNIPPFEYADFSHLLRRPHGLKARIRAAIEYYPCEVLFIHRDAEREPYAVRKAEIDQALESLTIPAVCVVPVRMQEAWLLFDEYAIRRAAGNPNGRVQLSLPPRKRLEELSDPKETLHDLLRKASERTGRGLKKFDPYKVAHLIGEFIDDFAPLRALPAFKRLESDIQALVQAQGW